MKTLIYRFLLPLALLSGALQVFSQNYPPAATRPDDKVYEMFDINRPPAFPGGEKAFSSYLLKNIQYPQEARNMKIQGKVDLTFVVEKDGSLSDIKVVHGLGSGCDQEAVRVLKASPKWRPARQKGRIVRQQYNLPIGFWVRRA